GALPADGRDDTEALRKAVQFCKENPNTVLEIPAGVYRLRDEAAVQLEQDAMSSKMGRSTEPIIYTAYYPYAKGLDFTGTKNLTIEAKGATLMCEGWMEPISLDNCENITIKGLTIDYKNKPFSDGEITTVEDEAFEAVFNDERELTEKTPFLRAIFWQKDEDRMWPHPVYFPEIEKVEGKKVRFKTKIDKSLLGAGIGVIHSFHFRPAILILRSSQVTLNDVTIHAQPGMGIVGFLSRDITMNRLSVVPSEGHILSSNTDATHFASCSGTIRFDGCKFQGHQDDATNVHGYYQTIMEVNGEKARLGITHQAFTHAQVADLPDKGDVMELVEVDTLKPVATFTVGGTEHTIPNKYWDVTFTEKLPEDAAGKYFLMNISKLPRLEFVNSTVNSHLARAVLVKTRNVLIQNNVFRNSTGTGIHVGAESWWQEGSHAENVIIRDNIITGCGRGTGRQGNASGIAVIIDAKDTEATYLHKNITIENNVIKGDPGLCGIYVGNAQDVVLKHNKILGCKENYRIHSSKVAITD
ncbi:MAG: right-handed parallel beta-helix repeat-containing protein, partial [Verrucomicrobia bacterium]|nr:right-handed parallel beta-helix repeat-containing protein [Verrucomicrobiota bacterium]